MTKQSTNKKKSQKAEPVVLTHKQMKNEDEFLADIPRFDVAALLGAPIWGPVQGIWSSILFYPLWLLADNFFVYSVQHVNVLSVVCSFIAVCLLIAFHFFFMRVSVPIAWHRAYERGVSKETFLKHQRIWAVVSVIFAGGAVILATYYHLVFMPVL